NSRENPEANPLATSLSYTSSISNKDRSCRVCSEDHPCFPEAIVTSPAGTGGRRFPLISAHFSYLTGKIRRAFSLHHGAITGGPNHAGSKIRALFWCDFMHWITFGAAF